MALIKLGAIVTQISGKIGGQTLGTSASGAYIKNSGTPRKTITMLQQTKMQRMATSAQAWRALTQPQRDEYIAASPQYPYLNRVGETKYLSGFAIFTKLRNNMLNSSLVANPSPLPLFTFPALLGGSLTEAGGVFTLQVSSGTSEVTNYRLFTSAPASQGISGGYKNQFFIQQFSGETLAGGVNVTAAITAKFGALPPGSRMYWRLDGVNINNGQTLKNMASGSVTW